MSTTNTLPGLSGEGIFTTGAQGTMTFDYLYDGGGFQSELAVFSLEGMEAFEPGTEAFTQEAARRALSGTDGYVLLKDSREGALYDHDVSWERNFADGEYQGIKRFSFEEGTRFAVMLVQNTSVQALADDPSLSAEFGNQALFSIPEANLGGNAQGRIADLNGLSAQGEGLYGMEDIAVDGGSDRDYNDVVFQIMGASADVVSVEDVGNRNRKFYEGEAAQDILSYSERGSFFSGGTFTVGEQGTIRLDYLFDGGAYGSELAIFSLDGMEAYEPGSEAFIKEAARRAMTQSPEGYRVIKDKSEGAKFSSDLMDRNRDFNHGEYKGEKTFVMTPGSEFAVMMVQDISVKAIYDNPALRGEAEKRVIFSIPEANQGTAKGGQIADLNGAGKKGWGVYGFEDKVIGVDGSDRDFNDIVFQVRGATVQGVEAGSEVIREAAQWLDNSLGQELFDYAKPFKEGSFLTEENGIMSFDYLYDGGSFRGELAVFSLEGMDAYAPGSEAFIQEAARRAASDSKQGRILLRDRNEGARFEGEVDWEGNLNGEKYRGIKTFELNGNQQYAIISTQKAAIADIANDPSLLAENSVLFSLPEANGDGTMSGQIVDLNGRSNDGFGLYAMEDLDLATGSADRDYNDLVFQIGGAAGNVLPVSEKLNATRDFVSTDIGQEILEYSTRENLFSEGTFVVGDTGEVTVDFLFDGGGFNKGELGIFNLSGMENFSLDSAEFLQEAAQRAISGSDLGHVIIQDKHQAARFQGPLGWEDNFNGGVHVGEQTFDMQAGDQFALILSQNLSLDQLAADPSLANTFGNQAIFSIAEANPGTRLASQIVDLNGLGGEGRGVYGMEDIQVAQGGADRDFNDIVFQIEGAVSVVTSADGEIREDRDWRDLPLGENILSYASEDFAQHIQGANGRQTLTGGIGNDLLEGFKGRDTLIGGLGNDVMTGGNGEDTFVLAMGNGTDTVTDFKANYDVLGMSDGLSYSELAFSGNNILHADSNEVIATLAGFDTTTLTEANFVEV